MDRIAPRQLAHLRKHLHLPVTEAFGKVYGKHFAVVAFALHLGPPETTGRLHNWFSTWADCINANQAPPLLVALTLRLLETLGIREKIEAGIRIDEVADTTPNVGRRRRVSDNMYDACTGLVSSLSTVSCQPHFFFCRRHNRCQIATKCSILFELN